MDLAQVTAFVENPANPAVPTNAGQFTGENDKRYDKPYVAIQGGAPAFAVQAGPSAAINFTKPNLPTHVRVTPGKDPMRFNFLWNQVPHSPYTHCFSEIDPVPSGAQSEAACPGQGDTGCDSRAGWSGP